MTGQQVLPELQVLLLSLGPGFPLVIALGLMVPACRRLAFSMVAWAPLPALLASLYGPSAIAVEVPWFFMGSLIGLDRIGQIFLFFTSFLWLVAGIFGRDYLAADEKKYRFFGYFLFTMSGNFGLILSQGVLGFYLFFSLMSFAAYGLIVHHGTGEAMRAGRIYLGLTVIGEVLLFMAMLIVTRDSGGEIAFSAIKTSRADTLLMLLLFFGFGIKAGALPLHGWLPLAHPVAPVPASAVLSGALIKAGLLGWLRFMPPDQAAAPFWGEFFIVAGFAAAFYGVVIGLTQVDAKTVLAYSSISQMGLMTVIVGGGLLVPDRWAQTTLAVSLYAMHHGLAKGSLFLGVGVAKKKWTGGKKPWWLSVGLWLPALSLAGLPLTSGAIAKYGMKEIVVAIPEPWHGLASFLLPLCALATMLLLYHGISLIRPATGRPEAEQGQGMLFAWAANLVAVAAVLWLWPGSPMEYDHFLTAAALWNGLWPAGLGVLVAMARRHYGRGVYEKKALIPAGDVMMVGQWLEGMVQGWPGQLVFGKSGKDFRPAAGPDRETWLRRIEPRLKKGEKILQRWAVVGAIFLAVIIALVYYFYRG
ncbi:MAG: complex I subunit 5 family protein [Proteobacteria bacterium]|nr:complex I subunit 5 family protein [Pseudomonadota bacterium]MBU4297698.1 complex I subunit 5 family protein [Pseudomonadota bacterium]MCG2746468.1 complex I subunit 5 family protein [Desulfobulbaceae bacterium]